MQLFESPTASPVLAPYRDPGDAPRKKSRRSPVAAMERRPPKVREPEQRKNGYRPRYADDWEIMFRHSQWSDQRDVRRSILQQAGWSRTGLERWDNCGAECLVEYSEIAGKYRLRATYCKCRHCLPCMRSKGGLIAHNLAERIGRGAEKARDRFRLITITLRSSPTPLADQIDRLQKCFAKLRKSKIWLKTQRGGAVILESKLLEEYADGTKGLHWHEHLHIVAEGDFADRDTLQRTWNKITGDSYRVDIKLIASAKDAIHYVTKYVSKGCNDEVWQHADWAIEYVIATKGVRMCNTYGTWRGYKLTTAHPLDVIHDWKPVGLLSRIMQDAAKGVVSAEIMQSILLDAHCYGWKRRGPTTDSAGKSP